MARVKGTILVDFVKTIKADKTGAYERHLTPADREVIGERILPSNWYPFETFKNCFQAIVKELAKGDMEKVRRWGGVYGENIVKGYYKGVIREGSPMDTLKKYVAHIKNLFDFGAIEVEPLSEREAIVTIVELDKDLEAQFHMTRGWLERSLELSGARQVKSEVVAKSWAGAPRTKFKISWAP